MALNQNDAIHAKALIQLAEASRDYTADVATAAAAAIEEVNTNLRAYVDQKFNSIVNGNEVAY